MTAFLPPTLLQLFAPRPPLSYAEPLDRDPRARRGPRYSGVASMISNFEDPRIAAEMPPYETVKERRERIAHERKAKIEAKIAEDLKSWDPSSDPNSTSDPFRTIIVARLSYDISSSRLKREFEQYGPISSVRIVHDKTTNKPRGYAFIEFEREKDMKTAYKVADGKKNRR